jgi:hypothetical protein
MFDSVEWSSRNLAPEMSRLFLALLCLLIVASYPHVSSAIETVDKPIQEVDLPVDVEDAEHIAADSDADEDGDDDGDDDTDDEEDDEDHDNMQV